MDFDDMIMSVRRTFLLQRRRAPVTWVRQWLKRSEDRRQCHNLVAELCEEDQPAFSNFMPISPEIFPEIG